MILNTMVRIMDVFAVCFIMGIDSIFIAADFKD
jgi:hypothetical protein